MRRAPIRLKADAEGLGGSDVKLAEAFDGRVPTIENRRQRLVTESFERARDGTQRQVPPTPCRLDGEAEAQRIALRRGQPPAGYGHGTWPGLADEMVAREGVDSIRPETVRKTRTKTA